MCEPITMSLLVGGGMAAGSAAAGAGAMATVGAGLMGAATTYTGIRAADEAMSAGYAEASGYVTSAKEMMKQIEVIETNAQIEENIRRSEYMYFTSQNLASAAASGVSVDSESFEAIRKSNERKFAVDETVAALNVSNQKRQLALQGQQLSRAASASLSQGRTARKIGLVNTGVSLLQNAVTFGMPTFGGGGSSTNVVSGPMTRSLRPPAGRGMIS